MLLRPGIYTEFKSDGALNYLIKKHNIPKIEQTIRAKVIDVYGDLVHIKLLE